jgi:hypothetical protein
MGGTTRRRYEECEDLMARQLAAIFLATALVRTASAREACSEADDDVVARVGAAKVACETRDGLSGLQAMKVFELLLCSPADPEQALSLTESVVGGSERDAVDIKWPLAHAFALARAGESVRAAGELEALARRLREGVGLDVRDFRFVTRVAAFGVYEEDDRQVFRPGDRLMAYAEVIGFTCRPTPEVERAEAGWRASLEVEFTLENRLTGEPVAAWGSESVGHATHSEIRDLHVTRVIALPDDLAAGEYELKVEVLDALAAGTSAAGARRLTVAEW